MLKFPSNVVKTSTTYVRIPPALSESLELKHEQKVTISVLNNREIRISVTEA